MVSHYPAVTGPLNLYNSFEVEADYTVVFLTAGSHHQPTWSWVWQAYRQLNRKYRKNLKRLVGPSSILNSVPNYPLAVRRPLKLVL